MNCSDVYGEDWGDVNDTKPDYRKAFACIALALESKCKHRNSERIENDGLISYHCSDCGMHMVVHPLQDAAYRAMNA